jgi:tRNA threonylcarbamoyladenosine biosynthesis protein TsaE
MTQQHPPILGTRDAAWPDEAACAASAAALAGRPALRDAVVELDGPLGAGKTTFARHLLHALGVQGRVKSPTYAVVETYDLPAGVVEAIAHFDFYRFDDPQEWEDAGLREVFAAPGLKLVEWAVKAAPLLPAPDLRVTIAPLDGGIRAVRFDAMTPRGLQLLDNRST